MNRATVGPISITASAGRAAIFGYGILFLMTQAEGQVKQFVDWPTGTSPAEVGRRLVSNFTFRSFAFETGRGKEFVSYPEVCAWDGALRFTYYSQNKNLEARLVQKYDFFLTPEGNHRISPRQHVDAHVFGIVPLDLYRTTGDPKYLAIGKAMADAQWSNTTSDGISSEARYWIDDMYMMTALQVGAFTATQDPIYRERAAKAMVAYVSKLQQPSGLFFHAPRSPFYWSRGNGWVAVGFAELLDVLPDAAPERKSLLNAYRKFMGALLPLQNGDGLWRQLLDQKDAWSETSGSAMLTMAMVLGVRRGWLPEDPYADAARKAWLALVSEVDEKGNLADVCIGTNRGSSADYYLGRMRKRGDLHGQAALLWAAGAFLRP